MNWILNGERYDSRMTYLCCSVFVTLYIWFLMIWCSHCFSTRYLTGRGMTIGWIICDVLCLCIKYDSVALVHTLLHVSLLACCCLSAGLYIDREIPVVHKFGGYDCAVDQMSWVFKIVCYICIVMIIVICRHGELSLIVIFGIMCTYFEVLIHDYTLRKWLLELVFWVLV